MSIDYNSIFGLLIFALDIYAFVNIIHSPVSNQRKLIWTIVVVLLPLLGVILWYFRGPKIGKV